MNQIETYLASYGKLPAPLAWERPTTEIQPGGDAMRQLPPNPYKPQSQKGRIYNRIARYGRVRNIDILFGLGGPRIMNTTGRCSEVRDFLRDHGFRLECNPIGNDGVYLYEVRP
ncbi:MAG: hypothetical protein ABIJ57_03190 [Pseudomonadota bacterium]